MDNEVGPSAFDFPSTLRFAILTKWYNDPSLITETKNRYATKVAMN